jgi:hypothetical protein
MRLDLIEKLPADFADDTDIKPSNKAKLCRPCHLTANTIENRVREKLFNSHEMRHYF